MKKELQILIASLFAHTLCWAAQPAEKQTLIKALTEIKFRSDKNEQGHAVLWYQVTTADSLIVLTHIPHFDLYTGSYKKSGQSMELPPTSAQVQYFFYKEVYDKKHQSKLEK